MNGGAECFRARKAKRVSQGFPAQQPDRWVGIPHRLPLYFLGVARARHFKFPVVPASCACRRLRRPPEFDEEIFRGSFFSLRPPSGCDRKGNFGGRVFARASDVDLASGRALHLAWCPDVRVFFDETAAQNALARLRGRAVALQIAALYQEDTPSKVEERLMAEGLMHTNDVAKRLARMVRTGMPEIPLFQTPAPAVSATSSPTENLLQALPYKVVYAYGRVISKHQEFVSLLSDPVWRLLDPRPISAGLLTDFAADAVARGVPATWLCRTDSQVDEADRYQYLLRAALSPEMGRVVALRCALIEMRYAEALGDLPRYETCLRAIPDILSTRVPDSVLWDALTGVPCCGTRAGKSGPWLLADDQDAKIMHLEQYLLATFSRVILARCAVDNPELADQYLRSRGLELDGPPRFASRAGISDAPQFLHGPPRPGSSVHAPTLMEVPSWKAPRR